MHQLETGHFPSSDMHVLAVRVAAVALWLVLERISCTMNSSEPYCWSHASCLANTQHSDHDHFSLSMWASCILHSICLLKSCGDNDSYSSKYNVIQTDSWLRTFQYGQTSFGQFCLACGHPLKKIVFKVSVNGAESVSDTDP